MDRLISRLFSSAVRCGACALLFVAIAAIAGQAQTFTSLADFDWTNGEYPSAPPVQGLDGNFYGITFYGGATCYDNFSCGTVFKITRGGKLTTLYTFCAQKGCADGRNPEGLVLATDGNFYGTTSSGGVNGFGGTVFKITPAGKLTTLYSFCAKPNCPDGAEPAAGLLQATDGNFYGTTSNDGLDYQGTVFKITPKGKLTTLHSFHFHDGSAPSGVLIQATDGNLYGTTEFGGRYIHGTVFRITPEGVLKTLHSFGSIRGACPLAGLVQAADGTFYGTTSAGGTNNSGTVFKITPNGKMSVLYNFCDLANCTDGNYPAAVLVQATDGDLYGTAAGGGAGGYSNAGGTVFEITPDGTLTTLYSFCSQKGCADGASPFAGLLQASNGTFYGTTASGGLDPSMCSDNLVGGCGTVFSLDTGLGPFVTALPHTGKVGASVKILGQGLTGTTGVSFNGTAASFNVNSDTYLTAVVPTGATTGFVTVTTPSGTLTSNKQFRVVP